MIQHQRNPDRQYSDATHRAVAPGSDVPRSIGLDPLVVLISLALVFIWLSFFSHFRATNKEDNTKNGTEHGSDLISACAGIIVGFMSIACGIFCSRRITSGAPPISGQSHSSCYRIKECIKNINKQTPAQEVISLLSPLSKAEIHSDILIDAVVNLNRGVLSELTRNSICCPAFNARCIRKLIQQEGSEDKEDELKDIFSRLSESDFVLFRTSRHLVEFMKGEVPSPEATFRKHLDQVDPLIRWGAEIEDFTGQGTVQPGHNLWSIQQVLQSLRMESIVPFFSSLPPSFRGNPMVAMALINALRRVYPQDMEKYRTNFFECYASMTDECKTDPIIVHTIQRMPCEDMGHDVDVWSLMERHLPTATKDNAYMLDMLHNTANLLGGKKLKKTLPTFRKQLLGLLSLQGDEDEWNRPAKYYLSDSSTASHQENSQEGEIKNLVMKITEANSGVVPCEHMFVPSLVLFALCHVMDSKGVFSLFTGLPEKLKEMSCIVKYALHYVNQEDLEGLYGALPDPWKRDLYVKEVMLSRLSDRGGSFVKQQGDGWIDHEDLAVLSMHYSPPNNVASVYRALPDVLKNTEACDASLLSAYVACKSKGRGSTKEDDISSFEELISLLPSDGSIQNLLYARLLVGHGTSDLSSVWEKLAKELRDDAVVIWHMVTRTDRGNWKQKPSWMGGNLSEHTVIVGEALRVEGPTDETCEFFQSLPVDLKEKLMQGLQHYGWKKDSFPPDPSRGEDGVIRPTLVSKALPTEQPLEEDNTQESLPDPRIEGTLTKIKSLEPMGKISFYQALGSDLKKNLQVVLEVMEGCPRGQVATLYRGLDKDLKETPQIALKTAERCPSAEGHKCLSTISEHICINDETALACYNHLYGKKNEENRKKLEEILRQKSAGEYTTMLGLMKQRINKAKKSIARESNWEEKLETFRGLPQCERDNPEVLYELIKDESNSKVKSFYEKHLSPIVEEDVRQQAISETGLDPVAFRKDLENLMA